MGRATTRSAQAIRIAAVCAALLGVAVAVVLGLRAGGDGADGGRLRVEEDPEPVDPAEPGESEPAEPGEPEPEIEGAEEPATGPEPPPRLVLELPPIDAGLGTEALRAELRAAIWPELQRRLPRAVEEADIAIRDVVGLVLDDESHTVVLEVRSLAPPRYYDRHRDRLAELLWTPVSLWSLRAWPQVLTAAGPRTDWLALTPALEVDVDGGRYRVRCEATDVLALGGLVAPEHRPGRVNGASNGLLPGPEVLEEHCRFI